MTDEIQTRTLPVTEKEYLEDNIATVAFHLAQTGAHLKVNHGSGGIDVSPGAVLAEISRRLGPAQTGLAHAFRNADAKDWDHLDLLLGHSGHGKFWRAVFEEVRAAFGTAGAVEADYETNIERLHEMLQNREEFIANQGLWKEFSAYLAEPAAPSPAALDPVTVERCAKVADDFAAYEQTVIDRAIDDDALSETGRKNIVSSAGSRQVAAEQIAHDIRAFLASGASNADPSTVRGCICQEQHRRGRCTEPGCPFSQTSRLPPCIHKQCDDAEWCAGESSCKYAEPDALQDRVSK